MNLHPMVLMLGVWAGSIAAFVLLPYQLLERPLTPLGLNTLLAFVVTFALGTLLAVRRPARRVPIAKRQVDPRMALRVLVLASLTAGVCFALDARGNDLFDLVVAYELRSETANALLEGDASSSSIWFQIGFLLYPACYVYVAAHVLYAPRVNAAAVCVVGWLPIALATLVMGGRAPILYAVLVTGLAWRERRKAAHEHDLARAKRGWSARRALLLVGVALLVLALLGYFAAVFLVRAEAAGGVSAMFDIAEVRWGVGFQGLLYPFLLATLGETGTYMVFVFIWYLVQGVVMANHLLGAYDGPAQWGVYGVDIVGAVVRRIAPEQVAQGFDSLLTLGTYGFLPSAWGSLYVDFGYAGLMGALLWGAFAGLAWQRIVRQRREDWLLVGPFVTLGIFFSVINTPFGFSNGFITHLWLLGAFLMLRRRKGVASGILAPNALLGVTAR
jgi:hypothetical protein